MRKGVCPYEYMDNRDRFNKVSLSEKEVFYSELNREDISNEDYIQSQEVFEKLKLKNLGEYYDPYLRSDALLLNDVFENSRSMCLEIYELDLAKLISAQSLAWQAAFKKTQVKLDLITDIDMLLTIKKSITG